nr:MAG TPA: hypothetical protein [Caudoviricetes sp.]
MRCVGMRFFSVRLVLTQGNKKEPPSVGYGQRLRGSYLVGLRLERRTTLVCQP